MGHEVKLRFIHASGEWPVAHAQVHIFALGKTSDPKSPLANDFPIFDTETDEMGWVRGSPQFDTGLKTVLGIMKARIPSFEHKERNYVIGDMYIPEILAKLIRIRIEDNGAESGYGTQTFEAIPGPYVVNWERLPVGQFDGHNFAKLTEFLNYLGDRYSYLSSIRPPNLSISLNRSGSPPPDSPFQGVFSVLSLQFAAKRRDPSQSDAVRKSLLELRDKVAAKLYREASNALGLAAHNSLSKSYEAILRKIADLAKSAGRPADWRTGPSFFSPEEKLRRLMAVVIKSFGFPVNFQPPTSPGEDTAALAVVIFLAGVISRGYSWGSVSPFGGDPGGVNKIDAVVGTSNACSENDFLAHCDLMVP